MEKQVYDTRERTCDGQERNSVSFKQKPQGKFEGHSFNQSAFLSHFTDFLNK